MLVAVIATPGPVDSADTARLLTDEERRAIVLARYAVHRALRAGTMTKSTQCQDCGNPGAPRELWSYFANPIDDRLGVQWLCRPCYRKRIRRKSVRRAPGIELHRKCPPYEVMKRDFVVHGMSTGEMAIRYGLELKHGRTSVWRTLKRRAQSRGEWPLTPQRADYGHWVRAIWIWALVKEHLREQVRTEVVYLAQQSADRFAPRCVVAGRYEVWPSGDVVFHHKRCKNMRDLSLSEAYAMPRQEAEDWGYRECELCAQGMAIIDFARENGINEHALYMLNTGQQTWISRDRAKQLLRAIGEDVPEFLLSAGELDVLRRYARHAKVTRREQRAG